MLKAERKHFFRGIAGGGIISLGLVLGLFLGVDKFIADPVVVRLIYKLFYIVIIHQILIWLVWRSQLCFNLFSKLFKGWDLKAWAIIFIPLLVARPILTALIGINDFGSLPGSRSLHITLGIILLLPAIYSSYSVLKYFGIYRAVGGDHFRDEYREKGIVRGGMYRFSSNVMYLYVFLIFWSIALFTSSTGALIVTIFQHSLVWVHYFSVESPDMRIIYD